ncbi:MAG TPA: hypothetical protein VGD69_20875 [Herpetosiphonaceae bacterium]
MADSSKGRRKEVKLNSQDFQYDDQGQLIIDKEAVDRAMQGTPGESSTPEAEAVRVGVVVEF